MTAPYHTEDRCHVCGQVSWVCSLDSTSCYGSSDLDFRPPQMLRGTMSMWLQKCPHCGYVSGKLRDETTVTRQWLAREDYIGCDGIAFANSLAREFYQACQIRVFDEKYEDAFYHALHCAWVCDDAGDADNAVHCRGLALALTEKFYVDEEAKIVKADLLRRNGLFQALLAQRDTLTSPLEPVQQLLDAQFRLAQAGDSQCHTMEDVLEDPYVFG